MPPKVSAKAAKKAGKKSASRSGDKKRKKKRKETYSSYIYKVLKQVHPDTGVSSKAMSIMNSFRERHFLSASVLRPPVWLTTTSVVPSLHARSRLRCVCFCPVNLAKHAVSEGTKAVTKYTSSK